MMFSALSLFGLFWIHPKEGIWVATFFGLFGGMILSNILGYFAVINKFAIWIIFNQIASSAGLGYFIYTFYTWYEDLKTKDNYEVDYQINDWTLMNIAFLCIYTLTFRFS